MDIIFYMPAGSEPRIRPAAPKRDWMDRTVDSYAYRCLPLNIANAHGWEILSPCGFEARWNGGDGADAVEIVADDGARPHQIPVSLFGHGTLTFHIDGVFRTPEGWNMWASGSPNAAKDGIAPLAGVIETDWSPYTFTMNWRFTRPDQWIRFEENEPFCFVFPVNRRLLEDVEPRLLPMSEAPELHDQFEAWRRSRNAFHEKMRTDPPANSADAWQKLYYRGTNPDGSAGAPDHKSKLRVPHFRTPAGEPLRPPAAAAGCPARQAPSARGAGDAIALAKRDWMLDTIERQRALSVHARTIHRVHGIGSQAFLDHYYAPGRPVILAGAMAGWPALERWTPDYLARRVGPAEVEYQGGRASDPDFEYNKQAHVRRMPFDRFIAMIGNDASNDAYITASNSASNAAALRPLEEDLGFPATILDTGAPHPKGMLWVGPAGTFTPLHHDLTNNLLAQVVGRKKIVLVPPSETPRLYNSRHVFSDIPDLLDPALDKGRFPLAGEARRLELILQPGDMLFIPIGWWHQVASLEFSVSLTYTNFRWPNDAHQFYPQG